MKQPYLLCVDTNSQKNLIEKFLVCLRTLKLTVSEEWTDGINCFLHVDIDSQKLIANQKMFVLSGDSKIGFISKGNRWDKMIFFVYCYKFRSCKLIQWFLGGCGQKWPCLSLWDLKFSEISWLDCKQYGKNQYKKGTQSP